ncbi:MAG: isoprenylcysteine carboxylmethyltransferase family protein [Anaerolineales bacterium]
MTPEIIYRLQIILAFITMFGIRIYFQSKVLPEKRGINIQENTLSLIAGGIAALTTLVFGAEYIFFPGTFRFSYFLLYPDWIRWLGTLVLAAGITLLGLAHFHLGKSFHSLVVSKDEHLLVTSGPYRWIRHPIYTAYLMNYIGGGLVAANLVLTFVPVIFFGFMIINRIPREEQIMRELFGQDYLDLEKRTGRLLPKLYSTQT